MTYHGVVEWAVEPGVVAEPVIAAGAARRNGAAVMTCAIRAGPPGPAPAAESAADPPPRSGGAEGGRGLSNMRIIRSVIMKPPMTLVMAHATAVAPSMLMAVLSLPRS